MCMRDSLLHRALVLLLVFGLGGVLVPALHDVAHAMNPGHTSTETALSVDHEEVECALCDVLLSAASVEKADTTARLVHLDWKQVAPTAPALSFAAPFSGRAPPTFA